MSVSQQGRGDGVEGSWSFEGDDDDDEVVDYCGVERIIGGGDDVGEITGRMAFHFVMVLVGLLEASIAAKREQDYFIALPIGVEAFVDGVLPFVFFVFLAFEFFTTATDYSCNFSFGLFFISFLFSYRYIK